MDRNSDIPEDSEVLSTDMSTAEPGAVHNPYNPPAHVAARFRRTSVTLRKSSAASSRRNSLSSTHSHQSNRSHSLRSTHSSHVAQHLRRASILETRKARLADRAAHAEQVRMRAALAKAMPRISNSEEKALAAQQARERHLAQVAATCAEEVRRSKKIAEDNKERRAAEERRYRLEMEEKLADAERRRLEYQRTARRPRATSVPATEKKTSASRVSVECAVKRIQAAWRARVSRRTLDDWLRLGLSIDTVHATGFDDISSLLSDERVLATTAKMMAALALLPEGEPTSGSAVRTFLSAFLILGHPAEVLSRDDDQEQDLITKAKDLIISFEAALSRLSPNGRCTPSPTRGEMVRLAHDAFVTAFNAWKVRDSSALVDTMVASFANLEAIWHSVKDTTVDDVAAEYREGVRDNQALLLIRIKRMVGHERAMSLIRKAVAENRRARRKKKPTADVRPRVAVEPSASPITEGEVAETSESTPVQGDDAIQEDETKCLAKLLSAVPPNRVLVHELALDNEYRIDASPMAELRDSLHHKICAAMRRGFDEGEATAWTVAMAENIRAKLLRLLTPNNSMHTLLSETLDAELIRTQCSRGQFSYARFFSFMGTILPKLCAPFRDAEVHALAAELHNADGDGDEEMISKLFKVLRTIDALSLDYSNWLLANAAPKLISEAPGYEQRAFARDLETGTVTLTRMRRWWCSAAAALRADGENRPTPQRIYARGLADIALPAMPLRPDDDVPETLQLDSARLARMRADAVRVVAIGATLLMAKNLLKRDVRAQWKHEACRMWDSLARELARLESVAVDAAALAALAARLLHPLEASHAMPPATRDRLHKTLARLLEPVVALPPAPAPAALADPVARLLYARLRAHLFGRLAAASSRDRVRAASDATEALAATGLGEWVAHVEDWLDTLRRVATVDWAAHGTWYQQFVGAPVSASASAES